MFEKNLQLDWLLDFYGDILPERTRSMMRQYYEDDLSLSEIAESTGITRQGVRHQIKKAEEALLHMEECLGMAQRHRTLADCTARLRENADALLHSADADARQTGRDLLLLADRMDAQL